MVLKLEDSGESSQENSLENYKKGYSSKNSNYGSSQGLESKSEYSESGGANIIKSIKDPNSVDEISERLKYTEIADTLIKLSREPNSHRALEELISRINDIHEGERRDYSIKELVSSLPEDIQLQCYKLGRLIVNLIEKYEEHSPEYQLVNNKQILRNIIAGSFSEQTDEYLCEFIRVMSGYLLEQKGYEVDIKEVNKELNEEKSIQKYLNITGIVLPTIGTLLGAYEGLSGAIGPGTAALLTVFQGLLIAKEIFNYSSLKERTSLENKLNESTKKILELTEAERQRGAIMNRKK